MGMKSQISETSDTVDTKASSGPSGAEIVVFLAGADVPRAGVFCFLLDGRVSLRDGQTKPILDYALVDGPPVLLPRTAEPLNRCDTLILRAETDAEILVIPDVEHRALSAESELFRKFTLQTHARLVDDLRTAHSVQVLGGRDNWGFNIQ